MSSKIYVTGDMHGEHGISKFNSNNFIEGKILTKDDYVIVLGDFGLLWNYKETGFSVPNNPTDKCWTKEELYWFNWLNEKPWTTLFLDGNHECIHKESDILTEKGWMNIVEAYNKPNIKIATMDLTTKKLSYEKPVGRIKKYKEKMYHFYGYNYGQCVSENHDVVINYKKYKAKNIIDTKIKEKDFYFQPKPIQSTGIELNNDYIKLITAIIMDGTYVDYNKSNPKSQKARIQFHLKKKRKIDYIKALIANCGIKYTERYYGDECFICFYSKPARMIVDLFNGYKQFPSSFLNINKSQFKEILSVIKQTDGTLDKTDNLIWRTTNINDYNFISACCAKFGYSCNVKRGYFSGYKNSNTKEQIIVRIKKAKELNTYICKDIIEYNDYSYCFTMSKGTLITRYKDRISLTGNCFTRLKTYHVTEWNGGKVQKISDSIIHLMRGEIYTINNNKIFTFGGAKSIDRGTATGTEEYDLNKIWWKEELPSQEEIDNAISNLEKNNFDVDYILTHALPNNLHMRLGYYDFDNLTSFLWNVHDMTNFRNWYCGHYHRDEQLTYTTTILFNKIISLGDILDI